MDSELYALLSKFILSGYRHMQRRDLLAWEDAFITRMKILHDTVQRPSALESLVLREMHKTVFGDWS